MCQGRGVWGPPGAANPHLVPISTSAGASLTCFHHLPQASHHHLHTGVKFCKLKIRGKKGIGTGIRTGIRLQLWLRLHPPHPLLTYLSSLCDGEHTQVMQTWGDAEIPNTSPRPQLMRALNPCALFHFYASKYFTMRSPLSECLVPFIQIRGI